MRRKGGGGVGRACGCAREGKSVYKPTISFSIFEQILGKFTKKILPRIFVANFQFTKNFLGCENEKKGMLSELTSKLRNTEMLHPGMLATVPVL